MTELTAPSRPANALNTCEFTAPTSRGDYLVQVSWPLVWSSERQPPEGEDASAISTFYIVDGNAYFFTATEISRRLEFMGAKKAIIVAVGYPVTTCVFHGRRGGDLTSPAADGHYEAPAGRDGKPIKDEYGGASDFLEVIRKDIMPHVEDRMFPHLPLRQSRKALFGHSFGGLFALNALFTRPALFDTYIAASPSIWWNNKSIVREQERAFEEDKTPLDPKPRLLITFGSGEQDLKQKPGEPDEVFAFKVDFSRDKRMKDNALEMAARLEKSPRLRQVWTWEFEGEDHGSAAPCGLQRGLMKFLDEIVEH